MNRVNLLGGLLLVCLTGGLVIRQIRQYRVNHLTLEKQAPLSLHKKLRYLKQQEERKQIRFLFYWRLGLSLCLCFMMYSLFQVTTRMDHLQQAYLMLNEERTKEIKEKEEGFQEIPVKQYPKQGIGVTDERWSSLFTKQESQLVARRIEQSLTQKLLPYLGNSTVIVTTDFSPTQQVTLSMISEKTTKNQEQLKENIQAFVNELGSVSEITQVRIQLVDRDKNARDATYVYVKETNEQTFSVLQDSDEKEVKGKG